VIAAAVVSPRESLDQLVWALGESGLARKEVKREETDGDEEDG
jgi:hypothetical protein